MDPLDRIEAELRPRREPWERFLTWVIVVQVIAFITLGIIWLAKLVFQ